MDTIDLTVHWQLVGALRWDRFDATFDQSVAPTQHFQHTDYVTSPRASLVYKPDDGQTYYFSYGTSFNPSAENLSLSARTADLGPEKDRTYEVGGKVQVMGGMLALTAAAFDTEMTNARITDPLNPALQALAGDLSIQGIELGATGNITENWELQAGYTYLDFDSNGLVAPHVKGTVPNTAHNQANVWSVYDFDSGWKVGAGATYLGERPGDAGDTAHIPSYVVFDAMLSYPINDNITLQLNGYNLFDTTYYLNAYYTRPVENHVVPGAGRTLALTAVVDF
jgi:catecholate siderophore receptor